MTQNTKSQRFSEIHRQLKVKHQSQYIQNRDVLQYSKKELIEKKEK